MADRKKGRGRNTSPESPTVFYRLGTELGGMAPIDRKRRGFGGGAFLRKAASPAYFFYFKPLHVRGGSVSRRDHN